MVPAPPFHRAPLDMRPSFLRRLTLSVLMPFVLLLAQQGALRHELSHWHAVVVSGGLQAQSIDADDDFCLACLSFAQIGGLAKSDGVTPVAAVGLRHHFGADAVRNVADTCPPALRSRGPPPSA